MEFSSIQSAMRLAQRGCAPDDDEQAPEAIDLGLVDLAIVGSRGC